MIMKLFAVRDRATESFSNPMFMMAHGQAIRAFSDDVNRKSEDNPLWAHPDDFDLFYLGEYDTHTGLFNTASPVQICIGKQVAIR